jgi:hypothetical protein
MYGQLPEGVYEALLAVTTPFSNWSCLIERCTTSIVNTSLRQLIETKHQKVRDERSKRIGTCAVASVFETKCGNNLLAD